MNSRFFKQHSHHQTASIRLDARKCEACWECVDICKNQVFRRINMPWHKHAVIVNADKCTGCLSCVKHCKSGALTKIIQA
jgi:NAD-dependent dihydropyrimidine dehydrogenase PreA subunit